ncbi:MAG: thioredoxin family protein [Alphaproteobacteria bacterium]
MGLYKVFMLVVLLLAGRVVAQESLGQTEWATTDTVHSQLTAQHKVVQAGTSTRVAWEIKLDDHWHVYWSNPGDSGIPPMMTVNGTKVAINAWPTPKVINIPPITNYGYEEKVVLLADVAIPANTPQGNMNLPVKLEYLYCKDVCMPGRVETNLPLDVGTTPVLNPDYEPLEAWSTAHTPQQLEGVTVWREGADTLLAASNLPAGALRFIPAVEGWMDDGAAQEQTVVNGKPVLRLKPDAYASGQPPAEVEGLVLVDDGTGYALKASVTVAPATAAGGEGVTVTLSALPVAMALAFLAGLMLNLMPCVLPVIALKIFGLVRTQSYMERLTHTVAYTGGVLATLMGMASVVAVLQNGGTQLGWGFQLQSPLFVAALVALLVALALNFWGVFTLGESLSRLGTTKTHESYGEAFLTGMLAVIVATPCTVPFMGGAMAYALGQPISGSLPVFASMGVGMAAPLLAVAVFPPLGRLLPKPGAWMATFKSLLGWPMLATALWLAWVFGNQTSTAMLAVLLAVVMLLALGLWLVGNRFARLGWLVVAASVLVGGWVLQPTPDATHAWKVWSKADETAARALGPVLVDFTADWCITCKVTEATVLNRPATQALFAKHNVTLLQADWTRYDAAITAELASHGRRGVPLYLLYRQGEEQPLVLPQLLTYGMLEEALARAPTPR